MTSLIEAPRGAPNPDSPVEQIRVAMCGSFRRAHDELTSDYDELRSLGCHVLSPADPDFVGEQDGFVFAEHERELEPAAVEAAHLRAMEAADFVWLHAP